ncbi:MAG TPA: energy transducer TonB [Bryobacteraceae bacterium]|nr:energy transducer TonB [Bryobacteraceae bacterium]
MFEQSFLPVPARTHRAWTVAFSFLSQVLGIGFLVLVPLIITDSLPKGRLQDLLFAPPPPPARPAPPAISAMQVVSAERIPVRTTKALIQPAFVPKQAQMIVDPPDVAGPVGAQGPVGSVVGGMPGGETSAVLRGIVEAANVATAPVKAPVRVERTAELAPQRVVIGGNLLEGKLIHRVMPVYPRIAVQVRAAGVVHIAAVIGTDGRIREMRAVSGHPLLVRAALDAVRQWVYQPTLLNGEPVEVDSTIDVTFILQQ